MKRILINILLCIAFVIAIFGSLLLYIRFASFPPKEANLINNFNQHRATFEQLKDMLIADNDLRRVANWGVETTQGISKPPNGNFPLDRYNQYLALLKQVGGAIAYRKEGAHPNPSIGVWGSGFAGDTKHVGIRWMDQNPTNQIANLDDHIEQRMHGEEWRVVYIHIDGNWYLWTDW
jgi:hypothetical protein